MRICTLCFIALLLGCEPAPPRPMERQDGRAETRAIRNTEAVGYSGEAIAGKVDGALKVNEQRGDELNQALEAQENDP